MSVESTLLLPEDELAARRETIYQTEDGKDLLYVSHSFDLPFETASADMSLQAFLEQVDASNDSDQDKKERLPEEPHRSTGEGPQE